MELGGNPTGCSAVSLVPAMEAFIGRKSGVPRALPAAALFPAIGAGVRSRFARNTCGSFQRPHMRKPRPDESNCRLPAYKRTALNFL